jgi:hypothetical protein
MSDGFSAWKAAESDAFLALSQAISINAVANESISDALGLQEGYSSFSLENNFCAYAPFIATGNAPAPPVTPPTLSTGTVTLTYPFISPSTTVVLRNPEFENRDLLNFTRINRTTRGGSQIVFADPVWPKSQVLRLSITHLSPAQGRDLLDFLLTSLGKEIGLLDHEGRQWKGIIINPDTILSQPGRFDRSIILEFEGALV